MPSTVPPQTIRCSGISSWMVEVMFSPWVRQVKSVPTAAGPLSLAWSMSAFQTGQLSMSVCSDQTVARGAWMVVVRLTTTGAVESMVCM